MFVLITTVSPVAGRVPPKLAAVYVVPVEVRINPNTSLPVNSQKLKISKIGEK